MAVKQYLDYTGLQELVLKIKEHYADIEALVFKGTVANVESLPAIADQHIGWMYNVATGGGTTSDFIVGPGHVLRDGDNVVAVNTAAEGETPVMKWDILGAVFKIEDRLQFGDEMPANPVDGDTFLYMGETTYIYDAVTPVGTENPQEEGWYELVGGVYVLSEDTTIDNEKTYYIRGAEEYVKGVIYVYDGTTHSWAAQTAGDTFTPITNAEIDALFE